MRRGLIARRARPPVVVGGCGGSGTRVVAAVLRELGVFIGDSLNQELDSIPLGEYDVRWGPEYVARGSATLQMRCHFEHALRRHLNGSSPPAPWWGWKHPQCFLQLPYLADRFSGMRFVHVLRDGRDMALSSNRNQFQLYGALALGREPADTAEEMIRYWAWANVRAADHGRSLGDRYLQIRLEDLCRRPAEEVDRLHDFIGVDRGKSIDGAVALVETPSTLGRWHASAPELVMELERAAGTALGRFGYQPTPAL